MAIITEKNTDGKTVKRIYVKETDRVSDGFHTFGELYHYRMLYNAALFNEWRNGRYIPVIKSKKHSDGELCFGGDWFIVMAKLPTGQISNHYEMKDWDIFDIPERTKAWKYDGHTPDDVATRLKEYIELYRV